MTPTTILIVEDDIKIRTLLRNVMEGEGFDVLQTDCATEAMRILRMCHVDMMTLDIHLGAENGLELAQDIRKEFSVPIVMITGKDDVIDRVVGLELGADDYITKPFHVREVIARVRSVLRRTARRETLTEISETPLNASEGEDDKSYRFDGVVAFPDTMTVLDRDGNDCALTSGDLNLLTVFLERPKRVLSRDQLMDLTRGGEWSPLDRTVDNQVARLRKKIERDPSDPQIIKTVRGIGYSFACDVTVSKAVQSSAKSA